MPHREVHIISVHEVHIYIYRSVGGSQPPRAFYLSPFYFLYWCIATQLLSYSATYKISGAGQKLEAVCDLEILMEVSELQVVRM